MYQASAPEKPVAVNASTSAANSSADRIVAAGSASGRGSLPNQPPRARTPAVIAGLPIAAGFARR